MPSRSGDLYVSPDCPPDVADTAVHLNDRGGTRPTGLTYIGSGNFAQVFRKHDVAYKIHLPEMQDKLLGVNELLANVALEHGMRQKHNEISENNPGYVYTTLSILLVSCLTNHRKAD